jgi:hypothetical protein
MEGEITKSEESLKLKEVFFLKVCWIPKGEQIEWEEDKKT